MPFDNLQWWMQSNIVRTKSPHGWLVLNPAPWREDDFVVRFQHCEITEKHGNQTVVLKDFDQLEELLGSSPCRIDKKGTMHVLFAVSLTYKQSDTQRKWRSWLSCSVCTATMDLSSCEPNLPTMFKRDSDTVRWWPEWDEDRNKLIIHAKLLDAVAKLQLADIPLTPREFITTCQGLPAKILEIKEKCVIGPHSGPLACATVPYRGRSHGILLVQAASKRVAVPRSSRLASSLLHRNLVSIADHWNPPVPTFSSTVVQVHADPELSDDEEWEQHGKPSWEDFNHNVVLHYGSECVGCAEEPIVERLYHCAICAVDLCEICVARGVNDPEHTLTCHFKSAKPKPTKPVRFAQKEVISHAGRRYKDKDSRRFLVRYRGYYWADEEQSVDHVSAELIEAYDDKETRKKLRKRKSRVDELDRLITARKNRVKRQALKRRDGKDGGLVSPALNVLSDANK